MPAQPREAGLVPGRAAARRHQLVGRGHDGVVEHRAQAAVRRGRQREPVGVARAGPGRSATATGVESSSSRRVPAPHRGAPARPRVSSTLHADRRRLRRPARGRRAPPGRSRAASPRAAASRSPRRAARCARAARRRRSAPPAAAAGPARAAREVLAGRQHAALVVDDPERHPQVRRQPREVPGVAAGRSPRRSRGSCPRPAAGAAARAARAPARRSPAPARAAVAAPSAVRGSARRPAPRAAPGTSQSKRSARSAPSTCSGTCTVTPSSSAPGLEAVVEVERRGRPGATSPATPARRPHRSAAHQHVAREGQEVRVARRSSRHQRSKCARRHDVGGHPRVEERRTAPRRRRGCRAAARGARAPRPPRAARGSRATNACRVSQSPSTSARRMNSSRDELRVDPPVRRPCGRRRSAARTASRARSPPPSRGARPSAARCRCA